MVGESLGIRVGVAYVGSGLGFFDGILDGSDEGIVVEGICEGMADMIESSSQLNKTDEYTKPLVPYAKSTMTFPLSAHKRKLLSNNVFMYSKCPSESSNVHPRS